MSGDAIRIFPLGDSALTVEFGNTISVELNQKAIALSEHFQSNPFPGFIESVPAYASTTIFYELAETRRHHPEFLTAYEIVTHLAKIALAGLAISQREIGKVIKIPVHFDQDSALDLHQIAKHSNMTPERAIELFTATTYRVFMLGFLPGFSYMGEVDDRIAVPRKETPRTLVPRGSVGIAGKQTGIYSLASPGGWQVIGRTDVVMFKPNDANPSYLKPGDVVKFVGADCEGK